MKGLLFFCLLVAYAQAAPGTKCGTVAECDQGECCQILSRFPIASRKRQLISILPAQDTEGTCQRNKLEGENCNSFEHANGYCGCGPGLQCHATEVKLADQTVGRRSMLQPRPGYTWEVKCALKTTPSP